MDENTAVARLFDKTVFNFKAVVLMDLIGDEVAAGLAEADEHAIARDEAWLDLGILISSGDIAVPAGEILAIKERDGLGFLGSFVCED
ncbi:hypothetical protein N9888_01865 [Akkermansiaceae bacterium]|nr:hypothetical protein [Akkermansiaceae bacterium]